MIWHYHYTESFLNFNIKFEILELFYIIQCFILLLIKMRKAEDKVSFDEDHFLKSIIIGHFNEENIKSIERFFIFRNLFEKVLFETNFSMNYGTERNMLETMKTKIISHGKLEDLKEICNYFKKFFTNGNFIPWKNLSSKDLEFNKDWCQFFIETEEFLEESITKSIHFLLYFVSRLRNNLFHGIKDVKDIENENILFYYANRFISLCIGD